MDAFWCINFSCVAVRECPYKAAIRARSKEEATCRRGPHRIVAQEGNYRRRVIFSVDPNICGVYQRFERCLLMKCLTNENVFDNENVIILLHVNSLGMINGAC
ncbi:hypothetical protein V1478_007288 [Vespula squamosa]|uniref:Uncharacterized protein n=1 Tax=Vespula squamosa TaxID=30214 RepID=A0ABD2B2R6_VESSQ